MYQISKLLLVPVDERWHAELLNFIDTGEASPEFMNFLDNDGECQRVVELALVVVGNEFDKSARQLKERGGIRNLPDGEEMAQTFARILSGMFMALAELTDQQRTEVANWVNTRISNASQLHRSALVDCVGGSMVPAWHDNAVFDVGNNLTAH